MVDRIRELLAWRKLSPTQFADLLAVGRPVVSHILSGRNKASLDVVQRIIATFPEIALPWLLSGTGPMLAAAAAAAAEASRVQPDPLPAPVITDGAQTTIKGPRLPRRAVDISLPTDTAAEKSEGQSEPAATPIGRHTGRAARQPPRFQPATGRNGEFYEVPSSVRSVAANATVERAETAVEAAHWSGPQTVALPLPLPAPQLTPPNLPVSAVAAQTENPVPHSQLNSEPTPAAAAAVSGEPAPSNAPTAPDKVIRRIVIFYQDGSFTDFKPEQRL